MCETQPKRFANLSGCALYSPPLHVSNCTETLEFLKTVPNFVPRTTEFYQARCLKISQVVRGIRSGCKSRERDSVKRDSLNWKTSENKDTTLIVCPILFNATFHLRLVVQLSNTFPSLFFSLFYSSVDRLNFCTRSSVLVWRCDDRGCNGWCRLDAVDDEHARGEYYF